jgi:hypothetical protein
MATRRAQPYRRGSSTRKPGGALSAMVAGRSKFLANPMDVRRRTMRLGRRQATRFTRTPGIGRRQASRYMARGQRQAGSFRQLANRRILRNVPPRRRPRRLPGRTGGRRIPPPTGNKRGLYVG